MFKLDDNFLNELGLGALPPAEKNKMLAHIYETLEMRVGMRLAEKMTNEQLDEFEAFINKNDEAGALKWLETNFPNYKQVVAEELDKLKGEISQVAPQIVQQALDVQASQPQPQPPISAQAPQPTAPMQEPQQFQQASVPQQPQPQYPQPQFPTPPAPPAQPQPTFQQPAPQQQPSAYPQVNNPYLQPQPQQASVPQQPQPQYPQPQFPTSPAPPAQPYTPPTPQQ